DGVARDAGVVHQDVDRPDDRAHVVEHLGAGVEVGDVAFGGVHAVARGAHAGDPFILLLVARQAARHHRVAGLAEELADRAADAAHAAGDEDDALDDRARAVAPDLLLHHRVIDDFSFFAHVPFLFYGRSTARATPMPPPIHSDA